MPSVTRKKSPNIYKSCPKMIDFDTFTTIATYCGILGQLIVAKGFKKLPKDQKFAQSGHTGYASSWVNGVY